MRYEKYYVGNTTEHKGLFKQLRGKEAAPNRVPDGDVNMVNETAINNGITKKASSNYVFQAPAITVSVNYAQTVFLQEEDFCASVNILILKSDWLTERPKAGLYVVSSLVKNNQKYDYSCKISKDRLNNTYISLPTLDELDENSPYSDEGYIPDFAYMEQYIAELEQQYIAELEQYLVATGLNDYKLTDEDKEVLALSGFGHDEEVHREFVIGALFDKPNLKWISDRKFNKAKDLSQEQTKEFDLPLVNAKNGNNGIMYFGRSSDFSYVNGGIDIVNDGAVSAGNVYPQPHKIGVLYNAYVITLKKDELNTNRHVLEYLSCVIEKNIKHRFSYSDKAGWDKVKEITIPLPIKVDEYGNPIVDDTHFYHPDGYIPDWDFMEKYIRAIEKIVIADVVKYKDDFIATAKAVVDADR